MRVRHGETWKQLQGGLNNANQVQKYKILKISLKIMEANFQELTLNKTTVF